MMVAAISRAVYSQKLIKAPSSEILVTYFLFASCVFAVYHYVAGGEFSAVLTMGVMFQCLAVALLAMQSISSGSAAGISVESLKLEACALLCQLSSTTWLNGYLPVDASGDFIFQATQFLTLAIVAWLLQQVLTVQRHSYQADEDSCRAWPMVLLCLLLAAILHADTNDRPLFDTFWMAGLFMGIVAVMPQLWLISRTPGQVQALTSHYIAAMAIGRVLGGIFMWHARNDITCEPWIGGINHAIWSILAGHLVHLILLADFAYFYAKAVMHSGLSTNLSLPLHV